MKGYLGAIVAVENEGKLVRREYFEKTTRRVAKFLFLFVLFAIFVTHESFRAESVSFWIALPFDLFFVAMLIFSLVPMSRLVVAPQSNGINVRNKWWKNYFFTWGEISKFSFGDPNAPVLDQVAIVELKNGEYVPLHALYMANQFMRPDEENVKVMTQELQRAKEIADANNGRLPPEMIAQK